MKRQLIKTYLTPFESYLVACLLSGTMIRESHDLINEAREIKKSEFRKKSKEIERLQKEIDQFIYVFRGTEYMKEYQNVIENLNIDKVIKEGNELLENIYKEFTIPNQVQRENKEWTILLNALAMISTSVRLDENKRR